MKRIALTALLLWLPHFAPAWAADEVLQVQMLKKICGANGIRVLSENRELLDASFFERIDRRVQWGIDNNQMEDAIRFCMWGDSARKVMGQPGRYRLALAQALLEQGDNDLALNLLQSVLSSDPEEPEAHFLLAVVLKNAEDLPGARTQFIKAAEAGYRFEECLYELGRIDGLLDSRLADTEFAAAAPYQKGRQSAKDSLLIIHPYNPPGCPQPYLQFTNNPRALRGGEFAEMPWVAERARTLFRSANSRLK